MVKLSKFQRWKRFHFYLWVLARGFGETTPTPGSKVTSVTNGDVVEEREALSSDVVDSSCTPHPWIAMVTQLPQSVRGPGWLSYNDIIPNMPLSLFNLLMPTLAAGEVIIIA